MAIERGEPGYLDPSTGLFVLTSEHLRQRGWCCDRGCRHCPYVGAEESTRESTTMSDRIQIIRNGGVADVRLNRPEKMNALDPDMLEALNTPSAELATDPSLRCVVLSGEGKAYCAGLDFSSFQSMGSGSR